MKFLAMQEQIATGRRRIGLGAEVRDVWNALFLVDDQILNDRQVLGCRLPYQMHGRIAVSATIIHMHVDIAANPPRLPILRRVQRLETN